MRGVLDSNGRVSRMYRRLFVEAAVDLKPGRRRGLKAAWGWVVPPGLDLLMSAYRALKRWAKLVRPSGAGRLSSWGCIVGFPGLACRICFAILLGRPPGAMDSR